MDSIVIATILGGVIIGQLVERFYYAKEMNRQVRKLTGALFSRNINDYLLATKEDTPTKERPAEMEDIELPDLSDEDFDTHIKQVNK